LRCKLAAAGRKTIEDRFAWPKVISLYFDLWREQRDRLEHARADNTTKRSLSWTTQDPTTVFSGFPSHELGLSTTLTQGPLFGRWSDLVKQPGIVVNGSVLVTPKALRAVHAHFARNTPLPVKDVLAKFEPAEHAPVLRSLHWLIKVGLLRLDQPSR
jgi:hypothetical protein